MIAHTSIHADLTEFNRAMREYSRLVKKAPEAILLHQARQLAWELYHESKAIAPPRGRVLQEAIARGWRMGRRGNSMTGAEGGVSTSSIAAAQKMLEGRKTDYFAIYTSAGIPDIRRVRFSGRKFSEKRASQFQKRLIGGRYSNRFAASALRGHEVEKAKLQEALDEGVKLLNIRSLSVAIEARKRTLGRGVIAVQWLPRVWRRVRSKSHSGLPAKELRANSFGGRKLGEVSFDQAGDTLTGINLIGYVPGTDKAMRRHGILARALANRVRDMDSYVPKELNLLARKAGLL